MWTRLQNWIFAGLILFPGFCGGMFLGALLIPADSGLAGAAMAFWYGIGGLVIGLIISVVLIRILKPAGLRIALIAALILSLLMVGWIVYRVNTMKNQSVAISAIFSELKVSAGNSL